MRAISSSIMAALVVVALFWGNCFSCPQALLALTSHQPAHQCCHKTKSAAPGCETQNLQQFVKGDASAHAPASPVVALVSLTAPPVLADTIAPTVVESSPPDFLSLQSILRV
jgi:hypothetical protein